MWMQRVRLVLFHDEGLKSRRRKAP
jgi:hypothetical protein